MKSVIIYYSHYGNTAYVAERLEEALKKSGEVKTLEIEYQGSKHGFIERAFFRLFPGLVKLSPIITDLRSFDTIVFGVPVWGGRPSAPLTKYLTLVDNIPGKKVICFYIYAIEASAQACAGHICQLLRKKGNPELINAFIPWSSVHNLALLEKSVQEIVAKLS